MKKPAFALSRKNQNGQVAIFVALIFQVIFVFFALLINVGLLVHHKINLQQSTDLAAYYGAMKQAESLNAMAHVNYQLRQAWKLLTWRYRVLGTFGMQAAPPDALSGPAPLFPVTLVYSPGTPSIINDQATFDSAKCPGADAANTADTPFFCIGHGGMFGWIGGARENICKINCKIISNGPNTVDGVRNTPIATGAGGNAALVRSTLANVNGNLEGLCKKVGKANIEVLSQMILSYNREMLMRSQTMDMLAGNLSNGADDILDLDGRKVFEGLKNTLKNNLTEANSASSDLKIDAYNSLSSVDCAIDRGLPASNHNSKKEFLKRIEFNFINFFLQDCYAVGSPLSLISQNFIAGSIYNKDLTGLANGDLVVPTSGGPAIRTPRLIQNSNADIENEILGLIGNFDKKYTIGYEKNPWCPAYFVVKASTKPRIPFLPLVEIQINAVSAAKPFGGTIGPWYGKTWDAGAATSQNSIGINDQAKQTDEMLPVSKVITSPPNSLKENSRFLLNFSRFVGDTKGVADVGYLGEYHAALINRQPSSPASLFGSSKVSDLNSTKTLSQPAEWPAIRSWDYTTLDVNDNAYDPLVRGVGNNDSFFRDLEISAIAPNQFDLTYYSIDPDFYNNYYKRLSDSNIFNKLKAAASLGPKQASYVRPDFGNNKNIYYNKVEFSVRNQIEIVRRVFVDTGFGTGFTGSAPTFISKYPELAKKQSSLLTGWTYKNFTDFVTFPNEEMNSPDSDKMSFGRCLDSWQNNGGDSDYKIPKDAKSGLPSTPGNCVTGGRVGYSVKIVSPNSLSGTIPQPLGGPGTSGLILNPFPQNFYNFQ